MSAPRIPTKEKYWLKKGKIGKQVIIHTHDDLDGIFSAIVIKNYLLSHSFTIVGYNIVNYQDGWSNTKFRPEYINICVDYAETHQDVDVYFDHHGDETTNNVDNKKYHIVKNTKSAYHLICKCLGYATDSLVLDIINMIDSAIYDQFDIALKYCLYDYNILAQKLLKQNIFNSNGKERLYLAGCINQMIKRSCHTTLIEVIHNTTSTSIYAILHNFKHYHPLNHKKNIGFLSDWKYRKDVIFKRLHKYREEPRKIYNNGADFFNDYKNDLIDGYAIINNLVFIPTGTWANGFRARAIIEIDYDSGLIPKDHKIDYILLQYGATLQLCGYNNTYTPINIKTDSGCINHMGEYMKYLLEKFEKELLYHNIDTDAGSDYNESGSTKGGGHFSIGSLSNINSRCINSKYPHLYNIKFVDIFKNKIIRDLTNTNWEIGNNWYREEDEQHVKYINLLIKNNIIAQSDKPVYIKQHIMKTVALLKKYSIPYSKKHICNPDLKYINIENIKKTQVI